MTLSEIRQITVVTFLVSTACSTPLALASFPSIFLYEPDNQVTDYALIDKDQQAIEIALMLSSSYDNDEYLSLAGEVYNQGGYSRSFAVLTLAVPLPISVAKGTPIEGISEDGGTVFGNAYFDYSVGSMEIR
eukprot:3996856-Ditylum_brightwellii.AAC.1